MSASISQKVVQRKDSELSDTFADILLIMDTSESDSDALTKPKFNSTVLGPDELPHSLGGDATTGGQHG